MASNSELQRKLNQGVESAKAGDRSTARRLLEEVVQQDERNELAWIWLATVATNASERREYLRRVLDINPRNTRAREALTALGEDVSRSPATATPAAQPRRPAPVPAQAAPRRGGMAVVFVVAALALLLAGVAIILLSSAATPPTEPTPQPTQQAALDTEAELTEEPTAVPSPLPSNTPVPIDLITRSAATLLPTQTLTLTPTPTPTLRVTEALDVAAFEVFYVSQDPAVAEPSLFSLQADGSNDGLIADRMRNVAFASDGFTFAFVREAGGFPEIFVSTLDDPDRTTQITRLGAPDTSSPSFSADGSVIVFSSSGTKPAPDLWIVTADGGDPVQITDTEEGEREPAWSPAGDKIAFTSDLSTPGFTEIFILNVTETGDRLGDPVQATDAARSSYSPSWSADGGFILFASDRTGDGDVYIMDNGGNNERLLTIDDGGAEDRSPAFSADGRWIVFASNRESGRFQTYIMRDNGLELRRLTQSERIDQSAVFRPRSLTE